jgi:CRISPR-associated protein Cas5d
MITVTAAKGTLSDIFRKPQIRTVVTCIDILKPIRMMSMTLNCVSCPVVPGQVLYVDSPKTRSQRSHTLLCDVRYRIHFEVFAMPGSEEDGVDLKQKWTNYIERSVEKGACYCQPCGGRQDYFLYFGPPTDMAPIKEDFDFGMMPYDLDFGTSKFVVKDPMLRHLARNKPVRYIFRALVKQGRLLVPPADSKEVLRVS